MQPIPTLPPGRLRQFDPGKDLNDVINLIEAAFDLRDDPEGQAVLSQMRQAARQALPGRSLLSFARGGVQGFVWEVGGKLVGNINLIPHFSGLRRICLVANVAVAPAWRGMGIGTRLTEHAIRVCRQVPAVEIWLQVRRENEGAIGLYRRLGFQQRGSVSQYRAAARTTPPAPPPGSVLMPFELTDRSRRDWPAQKAALLRAYPPETRWYAPVDFRAFAPSAWFNLARWGDLATLKHYSLREAGRWLGGLTWQYAGQFTDRLWLAVPQNELEAAVTQAMLLKFIEGNHPRRPLNLEYPYGRMGEVIAAAGFTPLRHMDWMKYFPPAGGSGG